MTVTIKAPKISAADQKEITARKVALEKVLAALDGSAAKARELSAKKAKLEKEAIGLHRAAAAFDQQAEMALLANQRTLARILDAIAASEADAADAKVPLFRAIDRAQEIVSRLCQVTYEELLDMIADTMSPFYTERANARWAARDFPAARDLVVTLLGHRTVAFDPIERLADAAGETLRKIGALLDGGEIYSFTGVDPTGKN